MAGLVAAARLRELGESPAVYEKGKRPGGSMLLSSCVVWRHRQWEDFRADCPAGDEPLQRLVGEDRKSADGWEALRSGRAYDHACARGRPD
ncbi:MAG: NAD(P)/FAD-dependent oxidoreductase [Actinobacteria bacterium]|nr:MAG: NAD(P)/FAD-dependent oxidoreductase [Actinomycetota bacterium]